MRKPSRKLEAARLAGDWRWLCNRHGVSLSTVEPAVFATLFAGGSVTAPTPSSAVEQGQVELGRCDHHVFCQPDELLGVR